MVIGEMDSFGQINLFLVTRLSIPNIGCVGQVIVAEVESRFLQCGFYLRFAGLLTVHIDKPPEDRASAIDVLARRHLFDHEFWIQPRHEMLKRKKLMIVAH